MKGWLLILLLIKLPVLIFSQNRYEIVIDEIMVDPTPTIGLPNTEWIELRNTGTSPISLQGWRIGDAGGLSGPMPNFTLEPDGFAIICASSSVSAMSSFANALPVSNFPSLDNDGDQLFLRAANGITIHAVAYLISWYQNELKKQGGWTLEMINTKNPCTGASNWKASIDTTGGTPGKKNSIDGINNDQIGPRLKYAYAKDSVTILAVFDEPIDSLKGATPANYKTDAGVSMVGAITVPPLFNAVELKLGTGLTTNKVYRLTVTNIIDCKNNAIGNSNTINVGLPSEPSALDIVINEILFNPKSNGSDYVELFNRGQKIVDLSKLYIANRNSAGVISSIKQIFATPFYIFPGEYYVITEDGAHLDVDYFVQNPDAVITLSSIPSYPDDDGDVVLLNGQGTVVDEVKYKREWHFKLIKNDEGVSLERIEPSGPSQDPSNWHSAASTSGYGTPGYKNSQYKHVQNIDASLDVIPRIFSPDNDGHDDIATIQYKVTEPGYVVNIIIFDAQGRMVRHLVKNGTLALDGYWHWDGLDEKNNELPIGVYVIYSEIFNLQGKKQHFKNTVVLARKLN